MIKLISTLLCLSLLPSAVMAIDESLVRKKLHTPYGLYLTPQEAYDMKIELQDRVLLVDIRGRAEIKYDGASKLIDANIPARFLNPEYTWSDKSATYRTLSNDHFAEDFEKLIQLKGLSKETPIILMCQSGSRVPPSARKLQAAGFKTVYSQYEGFEGIKAKTGVNKGKRMVNGWKNAGLPWSFKLNKQAMYFNYDSTLDQTEQ